MFATEIIPRVPFCAAEKVVDFVKIDDHIMERRRDLEAELQAPMRRYATALILNGVAGKRQLAQLQEAMARGLVQTFMFGYQEAETEINRARDLKGLRPRLLAGSNVTPATAWEVGPYCRAVATGRCITFSHDAVAWFEKLRDVELDWHDKVRDRCARALHNAVLDVIGRTLNAGRTLAAMGGTTPNEFTIAATVAPTRYAMRSEQLDTNTCAPCDDLHGTITEVGSPEYFATLPPTGCRGGGRCRGVEVYSDSPDDFVT